MLQALNIDGFRSYADFTKIELAPLTILAGANNVGKSSVIAALATLAQSVERGGSRGLALRGEWVHLGRFDEVVNAQRTRDARDLSLGLVRTDADGEHDVVWTFGSPSDGDGRRAEDIRYVGRVTKVEIGGPAGDVVLDDGGDGQLTATTTREDGGEDVCPAELLDVGRARRYPPTGPTVEYELVGSAIRALRYLSSYRQPPSSLYPARTTSLGPPLGSNGQFAAEYLYNNREFLCDILPHDGGRASEVRAVNEWNSYIFSTPLLINVDEIARTGYSLGIDTPGAERLSLEMVGLGISQVLPILPLVLGSQPGELIAVETPEAHLHPSAQHRLARLFIRAATLGRQVVVETHSEHLVNAIRLAVKRGEIDAGDVAVLFFEQSNGMTSVQRVELDASGRAMTWPRGFFDQAALDLVELL